MPDTHESAQSVSASTRIAEIKAAIPKLKADAENLQREIIGLAPACEAGNAEAKGRRKELRAQLGELNDAITDKQAAIVALQPQEEVESARAKAVNAANLITHIEALLVAREGAAKRVDECLDALIGWVAKCEKLGIEGANLCRTLLPENRTEWFVPPRLDVLILMNLVAGEVIDRRYLPSTHLNIARYSIQGTTGGDYSNLLVAVHEAAAKASMTPSEHEAQSRERDAADVAWIEQQRSANSARDW